MTYQTLKKNSLLDDFDHLINSVWGSHTQQKRVNPAVDIVEEEEAYRIFMNLPGYTEKDVSISVAHGILTISSAKGKNDGSPEEEKREPLHYILRERVASDFSRSFTLPKDASSDKIEGVMKNGVLDVLVPKREESKPRNIEVNAEEKRK